VTQCVERYRKSNPVHFDVKNSRYRYSNPRLVDAKVSELTTTPQRPIHAVTFIETMLRTPSTFP